MMETSQPRGRAIRIPGGRGHSKNKKWVAGQDGTSNGHGNDGERQERGKNRRGHSDRGRGARPTSPYLGVPEAYTQEDGASGTDDDRSVEGEVLDTVDEPELDTPQERERFWQELVKAREAERKQAIAEGKMDDPTVSKRLDEAITMVGTCMDMCPRYERYRRERENNLDKWEVIPGTKRVDHKRAVKIYERAAGDKTLPSDLRPPPVLKKTLDYLFHDLLMRGGFAQTYTFIRDRSRAVRSDFTMQHEHGPLAIECHDRCARFHILALHIERENPGFSVALEEQQLMNTLQSLKEFYEDQRGKYQAPTELEMRVYHRLIHIRDQRERREDIPEEITSHPVFQYTTQFRQHVQAKSAPITKTSQLVVDVEGMQIFGKLAAVLREQGNVVMIYLVACILERLFGKDTIDDIEAIRADLSIPEIIDGISRPPPQLPTAITPPTAAPAFPHEPRPAVIFSPQTTLGAGTAPIGLGLTPSSAVFGQPGGTPSPFAPSGSAPAPSAFSRPVTSAFGNLSSTPNVFGTTSAFGGAPAKSVFGTNNAPKSIFGSASPFPTTPAPNPITTSQSAPTVFSTSGFNAGAASSSSPGQATIFSTTKPVSSMNGIQENSVPFAPTSQPSPSLNPLVPSFVPTSATAPAFFPNFKTVTPPAPSHTPSFSPFTKDFATPQTSPPAVSPQPPNVSASPAIGFPVQKPAENAPPRIIERRQTLWEIPSSASPQPRTPPPATPRLSIPGSDTPRTSQASPSQASPVAPPPLGKLQPLALPPTPTARWFDPSSQNTPSKLSPAKRKSIIDFPSLQSSSSAEMLSPLQLHPPGRPFPVSNGSPSPQQRVSPPSMPPPSPTDKESNPLSVKVNGHASPKGKGKEPAVDLNCRLSDYLRTCALVKKSFKLWVKKTTDRAAWLEACRRSEAYKAKISRERMPTSFSTGSIPDKPSQEHNKRRRVSAMESSQFKRTRRRAAVPNLHPLTDEELAKRLKENHEDHQRRWAKGSFLRSIRSRLKSVQPGTQPSPEWRIWLSTNPENDGTAIWLDHKFDVPASGNWESETVFSIPGLSNMQSSPSRGSPGLIVFELTPLDDLDDDIDRKYRILDDCSRLRDVVQSLPRPEDLRFIPTLLVLQWADVTESQSTPDFTAMADKLVADGVFKAVSTYMISHKTPDLDDKFIDFLGSVTIDVEDRLLTSISWRELSNRFVTPFKAMVSDWLYNCWDDETLDWFRFGHVSQAIKDLQTILARNILGLVGSPSDVVVTTPVDLETPAHLSKGYVMDNFVDAHAALPVLTAEQILDARPSSKYTLPKAKLEAAISRFEAAIQSANDGLRDVLTVHRSPKRRAEDDDDLADSLPASHSHKRMRTSSISTADGDGVHVVNGISSSPPPSTSASTAGVTSNSEQRQVTIAMLRSLTRDVLKTYGKKQK